MLKKNYFRPLMRALVCFLMAGLALSASAKLVGSKLTVDKIEYEITSATTCKVLAVKDLKMKAVVIPATVQYKKADYTVTEIGDNAMHKVSKWNKMLDASVGMSHQETNNDGYNSVSTSYTVTPQMAAMFKKKNDYLVEKVSIPNTVEVIGNSAFEDCKHLREVTLPESVHSIGENAFSGCSGINYVYIPASVKFIGAGAFSGCNSISEVVKPGNIKASIFPDYEAISFQDISNQSRFGDVAQSAEKTTTSVPAALPDSDVDMNIPTVQCRNDKTFAVIIANENYATEVPVKYAINDGYAMKKYLIQALGIPEDNIHLANDATRNKLVVELDWLKNIAAAYDGDINIIVYYAGHGVPDEATGNAYLIPVDGVGTNPNTCLPLDDFYQTLGSIPSRNITLIMDACFSGAQRGDGMLMAARGVAIKHKNAAPVGHMIVLTATQGDETAYPYEEKKHGLFTYFILKKLQESNGEATLGDLYDYVNKNVRQQAIRINNKPQTPNALVSPGLSDTWKSMKLNSGK